MLDQPTSLGPWLAGLLLSGAVLAAAAQPAVAHAQDDDSLDGLDDGFLEEARKEQKKRKGDKDPDEALDGDPMDGDPMEGGFDEDPDWDVPPAPVDLGLDGDPPEGGPVDDGLPDDSFFDDDPPETIDRPPAPAGRGPVRIDAKGKTPLAGSFPARVARTDLDSVVVELPVLVARQAVDHVEDYWIVAEFYVLERKVAETRHLVSRAGISDLGPTFVWIKGQAPVLESSGKIQVKVKRMAEGGESRDLFDKTASYRLKG
jgi:hypothetical protein